MKTYLTLAFFCCLLGVFYVATKANEFSRPVQHRSIGRLPIEKKEPVAIRAVKINGERKLRNKKFVADDDWLRGLTIEIKNKTDKVILFAAIQLQFPQPIGSHRPFAIESVEYGDRELLTRPMSDSEVSSGIAPGQVVELSLTAERFEALKRGLPEIGYSYGGERVDLRLERVVFQTGTMWHAGAILQRDPSNPALWHNSELAQFKRADRVSRQTLVAFSTTPDPRRLGGIDLFSYRSSTLTNPFFIHASYDPPCSQTIQWSIPPVVRFRYLLLLPLRSNVPSHRWQLLWGVGIRSL